MDTLISYTKPLATGPTYTVNYDFNYDNLDRLTSATAASSDSSRAYNQAYQYDEVGNMTRKTGIGGWEVLSWDSTYQPKKPVSVRFDFESEGIGRRNITYNHANKPVQISYKGGTPTYLSYDGEGERIKKVQGSSTTIYVGDIFEKRGALEVSHIYANGKRIISRTSDGKEYYTHTDHLGSTNLVTDETGQVIEENGYLPFGGALFRNEYNGGTFKSAYRYTGQELDSEYELYNYNARLYDPVMSRFISPDTIIPEPYNPQSLNRYAYCLNNPLKYTDPSGNYAGVYAPGTNPWSSVDWWNSVEGNPQMINIWGLIASPYFYGIQQARKMEEEYRAAVNKTKSELDPEYIRRNQLGEAYDLVAPSNDEYRQMMINHVIAILQIDVSNVNGSVTYDPNLLESSGLCSPDGVVTIGPSAFAYSLGYLGSVIAHEAEVHAGLQLGMGLRFWPGTQWEAVQECQAWGYVYASADRFGLTEYERGIVKYTYFHYYDQLDLLNRLNVDHGDFCYYLPDYISNMAGR